MNVPPPLWPFLTTEDSFNGNSDGNHIYSFGLLLTCNDSCVACAQDSWSHSPVCLLENGQKKHRFSQERSYRRRQLDSQDIPRYCRCVCLVPVVASAAGLGPAHSILPPLWPFLTTPQSGKDRHHRDSYPNDNCRRVEFWDHLGVVGVLQIAV